MSEASEATLTTAVNKDEFFFECELNRTSEGIELYMKSKALEEAISKRANGQSSTSRPWCGLTAYAVQLQIVDPEYGTSNIGQFWTGQLFLNGQANRPNISLLLARGLGNGVRVSWPGAVASLAQLETALAHIRKHVAFVYAQSLRPFKGRCTITFSETVVS